MLVLVLIASFNRQETGSWTLVTLIKVQRSFVGTVLNLRAQQRDVEIFPQRCHISLLGSLCLRKMFWETPDCCPATIQFNCLQLWTVFLCCAFYCGVTSAAHREETQTSSLSWTLCERCLSVLDELRIRLWWKKRGSKRSETANMWVVRDEGGSAKE